MGAHLTDREVSDIRAIRHVGTTRELVAYVDRVVAAREAAAAEVERERIAAAIQAAYLGADFGRGYDGQESPDAALHHAYDEGLEAASRIVRAVLPPAPTEGES